MSKSLVLIADDDVAIRTVIEKKLQWTSMMNFTSQYKEQLKTFRNDI